MLPDRNIANILSKFGPQIIAYLRSVGYFDEEGPYEPTDLLQPRAMQTYLAASKAKNVEVWAALEKWLFPEMVDFGADFIKVYGLKPVINVQDIATTFMKKEGGDLIKKMVRTDQRKLTQFIWTNSEKNERVLARQVLKEPSLVSIVAGHRTETIIRTERNKAVGDASMNMAIKAGSTTKTWHAVGDKRTRPSHKRLNGQTFSIEEDIPGEGQYCGQISINCRCYMEYGFSRDVADHPHPSTAKLAELYA
jgi:SPP1 gp7 family putative phage head morphogenesis protein